MRRTKQLMAFALLSILLGTSPGLAQEAEHQEHDTTPAKEAHEEEHAEEAEHGERRLWATENSRGAAIVGNNKPIFMSRRPE